MSEPRAMVTTADATDRERFAPLELRPPSRSCAGCGYGIAVERPPERCPMCGGDVWSACDASRTASAIPPDLLEGRAVRGEGGRVRADLA